MKRHPALQPLSDDHHAALVLARRMREAARAGLAGDALAAAWAELRRRFARELEPHFRVEEERLFPPLAAAGEPELVARAVGDHARLRALVRAEPGSGAAAELAERLHGHVRFEERELFPRAEALLAPAALEAAGRAALEARASARASGPGDPLGAKGL